MKNTIYLDSCCFNRPFDDQLQPIIRLETEAKLLIQKEILDGKLGLVWSFILHYENSDNPYADRKKQISLWENKAIIKVIFKPEIQAHAETLLSLDIKKKDALHVACALAAKADFLVTTDKKLQNKTVNGITILNPMDFVRRHFNVN